MPKLAANLSWIYQEVPFLERFGAAAAHGFKAVEILFPYEAPASAIAVELKKHGLTQALFNLPAGDAARGERGLAALPGRERDFEAALDKALDYASALGCRTLHVMSGMMAPGGDKVAMHRTFVGNLQKACARTAGRPGSSSSAASWTGNASTSCSRHSAWSCPGHRPRSRFWGMGR